MIILANACCVRQQVPWDVAVIMYLLVDEHKLSVNSVSEGSAIMIGLSEPDYKWRPIISSFIIIKDACGKNVDDFAMEKCV